MYGDLWKTLSTLFYTMYVCKAWSFRSGCLLRAQSQITSQFAWLNNKNSFCLLMVVKDCVGICMHTKSCVKVYFCCHSGHWNMFIHGNIHVYRYALRRMQSIQLHVHVVELDYLCECIVAAASVVNSFERCLICISMPVKSGTVEMLLENVPCRTKYVSSSRIFWPQ